MALRYHLLADCGVQGTVHRDGRLIVSALRSRAKCTVWAEIRNCTKCTCLFTVTTERCGRVAKDSGVDSRRQGQSVVTFYKPHRRAVGPTQHPAGYRWFHPMERKLTTRISTDEVKNAWRYTSTLSVLLRRHWVPRMLQVHGPVLPSVVDVASLAQRSS
jgi:hypothetical protein